jgi:hypothetical protein
MKKPRKSQQWKKCIKNVLKCNNVKMTLGKKKKKKTWRNEMKWKGREETPIYISHWVLRGFPKCSTRIEIPYYVDKDQHSCIWFVKGVKGKMTRSTSILGSGDQWVLLLGSAQCSRKIGDVVPYLKKNKKNNNNKTN